MTKQHSFIRRILSNNKIALIFSFILAVIIWLVVGMQSGELQEAAFSDIPLTIDTKMSDSLDLQMFGQKDLSVSVKVEGKRYEVSPVTLSQDDFIVTASTVNVTSVGKHTLPITVRLKDNRDIDIISFSPESVELYFDYNVTESYPIEVQVSAPNDTIAADGFTAGEPICSSTEVTVSGAASEIQTIAKVLAKVSPDEPLTQTAKYENVSLSIVNSNGGIIRSTYVKVEDSTSAVTVTIPIYKTTQFTPTVRFKNTPAYFTENPINYICAPSGPIKAAVTTELLDSTESLSIGTIDFADIKVGNNLFTFRAEEIPNIRVLDDVQEFRVLFTMNGFQTRSFKVSGSEIVFNSVPEGVQASIDEDAEYTVTVIGLAEEIESLTKQQITASVDVTGLSAQDDPYSLPVAFTIDGTTGCWVSGRVSADVTVS